MYFKQSILNTLTRKYLKYYFHKCFLSKHIPTLVRAFVVYVRPLLEYASPIWNPHLVRDIKRIESVQRQFTKRLPGMANRLAITGLESLELRRLRYDLICAYKILSGTFHAHHAAAPGLMDINIDDLSITYSVSLAGLNIYYKLGMNSECQRLLFGMDDSSSVCCGAD